MGNCETRQSTVHYNGYLWHRTYMAMDSAQNQTLNSQTHSITHLFNWVIIDSGNGLASVWTIDDFWSIGPSWRTPTKLQLIYGYLLSRKCTWDVVCKILFRPHFIQASRSVISRYFSVAVTKNELLLHEAARKDDVEKIQQLIREKTDVNARNNVSTVAFLFTAFLFVVSKSCVVVRGWF